MIMDIEVNKVSGKFNSNNNEISSLIARGTQWQIFL